MSRVFTAPMRTARQAKGFADSFTRGGWDWHVLREVRRRLDIPSLPLARAHRGVWAVGVVRNERDIVGDVIRHLLDQELDGVLVADHGSDDGTTEILWELAARSPRVHVVTDSSVGHFQKEKVSLLAMNAWSAGARWIIAFDGDEFWYARDASLGTHLRRRKEYIVEASMYNMIPLDDAGPLRQRRFLMDGAPGDSKVAFRSHPLALVGPGNHGVLRVGGTGGGLYVAHIPYRSAAQVAGKYRRGAEALDAALASAAEGWHWRAGAALHDAAVENLWEGMKWGLSAPSVDWRAHGPHHVGRPLLASTWEQVIR